MSSFEDWFDYYALACGALALCGAVVAMYGILTDATATVVGGSVLTGGAGAALQLGAARRTAGEQSSPSPDSQARQDDDEQSSPSPDSQARQDADEQSSPSPRSASPREDAD